jgi:uncharacterized protein YndB with AHSA1/START domain
MINKLLALVALSSVWTLPALAQSPVSSGIIDSGSDDRTLVHVEEFDVPVRELWSLYTISDQVARWMAPVAQVDLRAGGVIRTNYDPCATIGDEGTIDLKIVAYVPERRLILQSDLGPQREAAWMNETIYANRDRLFNLIEFEPLENGRSRIVSWGLGYGQSEDWATMIAFFERGNAWSYGQLRKALAGEKAWPVCSGSGE